VLAACVDGTGVLGACVTTAAVDVVVGVGGYVEPGGRGVVDAVDVDGLLVLASEFDDVIGDPEIVQGVFHLVPVSAKQPCIAFSN